MPKPLRVAFLNCYNLFRPEQHPGRSRLDAPAIDAKVAALAAVLRRVCDGHAPDLIGLCELGDLQYGRQIGNLLEREGYDVCWSGVPEGLPDAQEMGLMILHRRWLRRTESGDGKDAAQFASRHHWLAAEFSLGGAVDDRFVFIVNHWPSDYKKSASQGDDRRTVTASELADYLRSLKTKGKDALLMVGDFNCEPFDRPLHGKTNTNRFIAVREGKWVTLDTNELLYLYNPMWRFLGEAEPWEIARAEGYTPSRPPGTCPADKKRQMKWRMLDQVLVSRLLLLGRPLLLREESIRFEMCPDRSSDHCALGVAFDRVEEPMTQTNEFLDVLKQDNLPAHAEWDSTMKILRDFSAGVEQFVSGKLKCRLMPGYSVNMGREFKPTVETPNGATYVLLRLYVPEEGLPVMVNPYSDDLITCDTHQMLKDELKKFLSRPSLKAMLLGMTP